MMDYSHWQAVFFDFDGVIADSVRVKTEAFAAMFQPYGEAIVEKIIAYHLANGGMPRYQKFAYYYRELLGQQLDQPGLDQVGAEFSAMVLEGVVAASFMPGALACLEELKKRKTPAFVVSGTPHEEMVTIVNRKGLDSYFLEVHGSPRTKTEIVTDLLARYAFQADHCLFIGDALADHTAAVQTGTRFLGITSPDSRISFPEGTPLSQVVTLFLS